MKFYQQLDAVFDRFYVKNYNWDEFIRKCYMLGLIERTEVDGFIDVNLDQVLELFDREHRKIVQYNIMLKARNAMNDIAMRDEGYTFG